MPAPRRLKSTAPKITCRSSVVDLPLDLQLPQRQRHRDDALAAAGADRRGGLHVARVGELFDADEGRQPIEHDPPVDPAGRPRRQQPRREQVALARRLEARPLEQVHVLVDGAADEHHDLVVDGRQPGRAALLQGGVVLDEPLRDGGRPGGRVLDAGPGLRREVRPHGEREDRDGHHGPRDVREEQLAVEARPELAEQRAAARRRGRRRSGRTAPRQSTSTTYSAPARTTSSARFTR